MIARHEKMEPNDAHQDRGEARMLLTSKEAQLKLPLPCKPQHAIEHVQLDIKEALANKFHRTNLL